MSGSGSEQEIATYQHTQPLHYSERLPISVSWDMSEEKYQQGGIIEVFYFGSDGKVAEEVKHKRSQDVLTITERVFRFFGSNLVCTVFLAL